MYGRNPQEEEVYFVATFLQTLNHAKVTWSRKCCLKAEAFVACCEALNFFDTSALMKFLQSA
jgi:hypothetical protein